MQANSSKVYMTTLGLRSKVVLLRARDKEIFQSQRLLKFLGIHVETFFVKM